MEEIVKLDADESELYENDLVARTAWKNFGIKYMFPWQRLVVSNILEAYEYQKQYESMTEEEKNQFDLENTDSFCKGRQIVLLPTGAGKSLCFQVPALLLDGPSLVIYPLLALMSDQQRRMEEGGLGCVVFRGGQSEQERKENFERIKNGAKIILANPEVLQSDELLTELCKVGIRHIAIDEAHCVSEWGKSFRPAYLTLGKVISRLSPPMITAFTATASPEVLASVAEILFENQAHVVRSESDRKNIHYYVRKTAAKRKEVLFLAKTELRPMIVFCGTRNKTEEMSRELNVCFGYQISRFYHAGLEKSEKDEIEKWFFNSKDGVLCATCAYGMGVDKKDIKTVVHLEASATAEAYIQEAGRGGRDGSVAKAILLWSLEDSVNFGLFQKGSRERALKEFAETTDCRRQVLLDALGGEQAFCSGCDLCNAREEKRRVEALRGVKKWWGGRRLERDRFVSDWEITYNIVKKNKRSFSRDDLESEVFSRMNNRYRKTMGVNIWTHQDAVEVVKQLEDSGKIAECGILWKGKLKTNRPE